jgi:hypothetical protein
MTTTLGSTFDQQPIRMACSRSASVWRAAPLPFWTRVVSPETMFFVATVQALFPYLLWHFRGLNPNYRYGVTYIPALIYTLGYIAFFIGTRFGRLLSSIGAKSYAIPPHSLRVFAVLLIGAGALQFFFAARLYGGVPLLNYLKETTDVWEINTRQTDSVSGQFGLLTLTTFFLSSAAMLLLVKAARPGLFTRVIVATCLVLCFLISSMAGKRQGLLMCAFIVGTGVMTRLGDPIRQAAVFLGFSPRGRSSLLVNCIVAVICVGALGIYLTALRSLRVGGGWSSFDSDDIVKYLEFPLINFESQVEIAGFGPQRYAITPLLSGFLPQKILDSSETLYFDRSIYPEPTASAGIYGPLHLWSGLAGCVVFAFILGAFCKFAHLRAMHSDLYLLIYAQCSWPLFVSYSFNLFLMLIFVLGPILAYCAFCLFVHLQSQSKAGLYPMVGTPSRVRSSHLL